MKHIIDIETWERKDNYNFRGFANSWIAITSEVDCTELTTTPKPTENHFFCIIFMPYCALPTR
mgnify:FL=1